MAKVAHLKTLDSLCEALGLDPNNTGRLLIDIKAGGELRIYTMQFADEKMDDALLSLVQDVKLERLASLKEVEIG